MFKNAFLKKQISSKLFHCIVIPRVGLVSFFILKFPCSPTYPNVVLFYFTAMTKYYFKTN